MEIRPYKSKQSKIVSDLYNSDYSFRQITHIDWDKSENILTSCLNGDIRIQSPRQILWEKKMEKGVKKSLWLNQTNIVSINYGNGLSIVDVSKSIMTASFTPKDYLTTLVLYEYNYAISGSKNYLILIDLRTNLNPIKEYRKHVFGQSLDTILLPNEAFVNSGDNVSKNTEEANLLVWDIRTGCVLSNQIYREKYTCPKLLLERKQNPSRFFAQTNGNYIASFSTTPPYKMYKHLFQGGHLVMGYTIGMDQTYGGKYIFSGSSDGKLYKYNAYNGNVAKIIFPANWALKGPQNGNRENNVLYNETDLAITALAINPYYCNDNGSSHIAIGTLNGQIFYVTL